MSKQERDKELGWGWEVHCHAKMLGGAGDGELADGDHNSGGSGASRRDPNGGARQAQGETAAS